MTIRRPILPFYWLAVLCLLLSCGVETAQTQTIQEKTLLASAGVLVQQPGAAVLNTTVPDNAAEDKARPPEPEVAKEEEETVPTMFPRLKGRIWISGQANFIFQTNPPFPALYSGPNSFQPYYEKATSRVLTLYTGLQLSKLIEVLADAEESGGQGLSQALGLARLHES